MKLLKLIFCETTLEYLMGTFVAIMFMAMSIAMVIGVWLLIKDVFL